MSKQRSEDPFEGLSKGTMEWIVDTFHLAHGTHEAQWPPIFNDDDDKQGCRLASSSHSFSPIMQSSSMAWSVDSQGIAQSQSLFTDSFEAPSTSAEPPPSSADATHTFVRTVHKPGLPSTVSPTSSAEPSAALEAQPLSQAHNDIQPIGHSFRTSPTVYLPISGGTHNDHETLSQSYQSVIEARAPMSAATELRRRSVSVSTQPNPYVKACVGVNLNQNLFLYPTDAIPNFIPLGIAFRGLTCAIAISYVCLSYGHLVAQGIISIYAHLRPRTKSYSIVLRTSANSTHSFSSLSDPYTFSPPTPEPTHVLPYTSPPPIPAQQQRQRPTPPIPHTHLTVFPSIEAPLLSPTRIEALERNRVAAKKSRSKKRRFVDTLAVQNREHSARNRQLKQRVCGLQQEADALRGLLRAHRGCGGWNEDMHAVIAAYLARLDASEKGEHSKRDTTPRRPVATHGVPAATTVAGFSADGDTEGD